MRNLSVTLDLIDELKERLSTINDNTYYEVINVINNNLIDDYTKGYLTCEWDHITDESSMREGIENLISLCDYQMS